jgi:hypothetical protein
MAKRKTTTEKKTLTEAKPEQPVITIQSITNTQDTLFDCMKRRREKEH